MTAWSGGVGAALVVLGLTGSACGRNFLGKAPVGTRVRHRPVDPERHAEFAAGVDRVEQSRHYIYIYISPAAAHGAPQRAFADPEQAEAFYRPSETRRQAAE
jgi:hypothetical protein